MKKGISLLLAITLIFSMGVGSFAQVSDISTHWADLEISYLVERGVLNGYPDGTFRPDNPMTKVEFYKVINELLNFEETVGVTYLDVNSTDWYYENVGKALAAGYISSAKLLLPNENITRQEVARILGVVYKLNYESDAANVFLDAISILPETKGYIGVLLENDLLHGYPDGTFKPTANITRAEVVKLIYNVLGKLNDLPLKRSVDKSELEESIEDANNLSKSKYTSGTWKKLESALEEAIDVFENKDAAQAEVDVALEDLLDAMDDLEKVSTTSDRDTSGSRYALTIGTNKITTPVTIRTGTVSGDVTIDYTSSADLDLPSGMTINGSLTVFAPLATVNNYATVTGEIIIKDVASTTWNEYADGNTLIIEDENGLVLNIVGDVAGITISTSASGGIVITVAEGANILSFEINAPVTIISPKPIKATIKTGVVVTFKANENTVGKIVTGTGKEVTLGTNVVPVSAISVTGDATVINGQTLQLGITVTPENATNKAVTWSVIAGTGEATINEDGLLTATGVGTVTVTATNVASDVSGTKLVTVTKAPNESQLAPTGLIGMAPITLGGSDGKITGTTTAMEYKLTTDTDWIQVIGTEITGLATGTYEVRLAAKEGYNAGASAYVVILADNFESEEGDNSYQTAKLIATDGTLQTHAIYPAGDEDWVKFYAEAGNIYQIATSNLIDDPSNDEEIDTYIELYNMDGSTLIFDNDDDEGLESKISFSCSITGTYYVRIMHYTHSEYDFYNDTGTGSYDISITKSATPELLSIYIDSWDYKDYYVGDLLDITGLIVMGQYSDDIEAVETITTENVTGFDSSAPTDSQILTVTINGKTDTYNINIKPAHTLEEAKSVAEDELDSFIAENTTTEADILAVVREVIKNINITAEFTVAFVKTEAVVGTAGSITGIITLTNNADSQTETIIVNKEIAVLLLVTKITVTDEDDLSTIENGQTLWMYADVTPWNATNQAILWTVEAGTGEATISANGLLRATGVGTVTVIATNVASGVTGSKTIDITEKALTIIGYRGSATELDIPQVIVGSELDEDNFYGDFEIEGTIRSGETGVVTTIGDYAFAGNVLTRVTIPNSVVVIGEGAFEDNQLDSITIPNSVEHIGGWSLYGNKLTSITIGPDVIIENYLLIGNNYFRDTYLGIGGGAGIYSGTQNGAWTRAYVAISDISVSSADDVTTVANGKTLQMSADLTPPNATNVPLTWSVVTLDNGTATIGEDGLLIATGVGTVTVTALDTITGSYGTKNIIITMGDQLPPEGLGGVAPTTFGGSDGKITGTTTAMEYKLEAAETYTVATETETTGLVAGTYNVRYAAKTGFNAGAVATLEVEIGPNAEQASPKGLFGVAPTAALNDGKITGTTTDMEYKLAVGGTYVACSADETIVAAGDYVVRYAAKPGLNAGPTVAVTVPAYVAPDTVIIKGADLVDGVASFTWSSVNGIGRQNPSETSTTGYTYFTDGAYLRLQVKDTSNLAVKFADVFQTFDDGNNATGGMTLQTNVGGIAGTINDMEGSNRERADWGVAGLEGYLTNLPNDGNYVFYGIIQNDIVGTKTVGFMAGDERTINMTLTPKADLIPGTYTVIVETLQQGSTDVKGTINYKFVVKPLVTGINVTGANDVTAVANGETLQMNATVLPPEAEPSVIWSVEAGTGIATINETGLLTGISPGTITVIATAKDSSMVKGTLVVTVVPIILVSTFEDLNSIRNNLSGHYIQVADIDLWNAPWTPIAENYGNMFSGSYNGNGYKISNLRINPVAYDIGLFGYVSGNIENVRLENVSIDTQSSSIGGLVGFLSEAGTVKNSHIAGVGSIKGKNNIGGLVGANLGLIEECSVSGNIEVESIESIGMQQALGGLVGLNGGTIIKSFATVKVYGDVAGIGGLVGINYYPGEFKGKIIQSYATGDVSTTQFWVGGLVGDNRDVGCLVTESYATGKVVGGTSGGLIGLKVDGTVQRSYYDKETTLQTDNGVGLPRTTLQMIKGTENSQLDINGNQAADGDYIYKGWDSSVWDFGTDADYPSLSSNAPKSLQVPKVTPSELRIIAPKSTDATLSDLTVEGITVAGFAADIMTYNVELAAGTTEVPIVVATETDAKKASVEVTPASSLPGATKVLVTAEDETTTKTYIINFTVAVSEEPNEDQAAPTDLVGVAPTVALNDGKIIGTTIDMEYKLADADDSTYAACSAEATTVEFAGDYVVRFADKLGFNASPTTVVSVSAYVEPDTTSPLITMLGNETENVAIGAEYSDAGAIASDNKDGDITANIVTTISNDVNSESTFNSSVVATYTFHYNVSDIAGNAATEVTRTINVTI